MEIFLPDDSGWTDPSLDSSLATAPSSDVPLEGEGQGRPSSAVSPQSWLTNSNDHLEYAPRPSAAFRTRMRSGSLARLRARIPHNRTISGAHQAWNRATAGGGLRENARFLDHFRYVLVASQLLEEDFDHASYKSSQSKAVTFDTSSNLPPTLAVISYKGAAVAACLAFLAVWVFRRSSRTESGLVALLLVSAFLAFTGSVVYLHGRRQMVRYVHLQVLETATALVKDLQSFELASASSGSLIQEVEVIAKGHVKHQGSFSAGAAVKRCIGLRRALSRSRLSMCEALASALTSLRKFSKADDYDKLLDVYDIPREALDQSLEMHTLSNSDRESLGVLRILQHRATTLRRAVLCALLSLDTEQDMMEYQQWRAVADIQATLSKASTKSAAELLQALEQMEKLVMPATPVKVTAAANERIKAQVRKIANVSTSIKTLQAKMTLLKEESNDAITQADDLSDLGPRLMSQYESIGAEIETLRLAWESGKAALTANIVEQEKRLSLSPSLASPSMFSPLGSLPAVDEGGPAEALLALTGARTPTQDPSMSPASSMPATPSDEEVFEAEPLPVLKQRSSLSRDDRIRLMREERERAEERKARRESGLNMMRELKTVINLRKKPDAPSGARVTSI